MYGDTEVIRGLARTMRAQAEDIRREADRLLGSAESVAWSGVAAEAMRMQARSRWAALQRNAALHEDAGRALDRHADEVDRVKALIAAIERKVMALVAAARERLAGIVSGVADAFGAADPVDVLLDRFLPPPPGHRDWLAVDLPGLT
jgi:hypothetical protein